jgi:hypothetical protein
MSHDHQGPPKEPIGWTDKADSVKRFFLSFYVVCGLLIVAELILGRDTEHPHPYEWPAFFHAAYGFVSFWFLVLVAKPMRKLLIRSEEYYDE